MVRFQTRRKFIKTAARCIGAMALYAAFPLSCRFRSDLESQALLEMNVNAVSIMDIARKKLHHGDGRYLNPFNPRAKRGFFRVLKWRLFSENQYKEQYADEPLAPVEIDWAPVVGYRGLSVTFINHASVLIRDRGTTILVDPVFFGLFPPIKDFTPLRFDFKAMPVPDHVLITHGHYDHLDKATLKSFDGNTHMITPLGYGSVFEEIGRGNRTELDWFDTYRDDRREMMLLPCNHWTMRNPFVGPNRSLWGAYLIRTAAGANIFISGDTAYFEHFKEIGERFDIDIAIFNLGAYAPRWIMKDSHMTPQETIQAFRDIRAEKMIIVHWGTFRLGDEPVHLPPLDLKRLLEKENMLDRLIDITHGETLYL